MRRSPERRHFLSFLRTRGLRVTSERLAVFEALFAHHGHIGAEQLLREMRLEGRKVSRATVYRNLELLVEAGLARRQRLAGRRVYEHVHTGQRHDHLVCRGCDRVIEFLSPGIAALQRQICRAHGFVPEESRLEISGLCQDCAGARDAVGGAKREAA